MSFVSLVNGANCYSIGEVQVLGRSHPTIMQLYRTFICHCQKIRPEDKVDISSDFLKPFLKGTRICASLGLRMKFKTLFNFMSDHDLLLFFNMSNQFLAPGGLNAECVKVSVM